jgi:predicted nucleic-acid-binding protein
LIGLDTNVIVRYVAQDDRAQALAATRLLEHELTAGNPGYLSLVALAEVVWVMVAAYGADRPTVTTVVEGLLSAPHIRVQEAESAWLALLDFREPGAKNDFSDALIGRLGSRAGCSSTVTFDRGAAKHAGFKLLG